MSFYIYEDEGKSRAEVEARLLGALGVKKDQVRIEDLSASGGIMRLVKRENSVLRAYPQDDTPLEAQARGVLLSIVQKLGVSAEIESTGERDENLYIELASEESGFLIGKHGRTLDAVQFLVNLIVNTRTHSGRRIMVDVEKYRERRERSLKRLASRMAERVAKSGRPILLNYMNPYERRIIHLALESDDRVYTESDGNGVYKRVRVIPTKQASGKSGGGRSGGERTNGGGGGGGGGRGRRGRRERGPRDVHGDVDGNRRVEESEKIPDVDGNRREDYDDFEYSDPGMPGRMEFDGDRE